MPSDPTCLNSFYAQNHEFIVGPCLIACLLAISGRFHGMEVWGTGALQYVAFSMCLQFAFHGWMCCYERELRAAKLQQEGVFDHSQAGISSRSTAVLCSNLIYALVPARPLSRSWGHFLCALIALSLIHDAYFFLCHRAFHKNIWLYNRFHRLHHKIREPMVFAAYYITYQSHFVTEQLVVCASSIFAPHDVLVYYLYFSLFDTFAQHSGIEVDHLSLPLLPCVKVGHIRRLLTLYSIPFGSYTTAHHDWHHERNSKNYALAFTYLDKLAGTHYAGRTVPASAALETDQPQVPSAPEINGAQPEAEPQSLGLELKTTLPPRIAFRQASGG